MAQPDIKCVYVLHGPDAFLRDAAKARVLGQIIGQSDPQTSVTSFEGDTELAAVLDELRTMPFLSPMRAVVVRDADVFVTAYREQLETYLQSPSRCSSLVLTVLSWPTNTRLYKLVGKIGEAIECMAPDERMLPGWIKEATAGRGKKINPEAAQLLATWVGADLGALDSEIEKLCLYVGKRTTIEPQDLAQLVSATAGPAAFALTNAITAGDVPAALKAMNGMLIRRGEEFKALGMIVWHLRRALVAQQNLLEGLGENRALPRMPFEAQRPFLAMLKRRPLAKLQADFRRLIATDLAMKSGANPVAVLQELVIALCR